MADKDNTADLKGDLSGLSFEDALEELEKIVRQLEEGGGKLDDAIGAYERGAVLKKHCEEKLREARVKVDKISLGPDGALTAEPAASE
jgi:exodeoxyribonuclease VII small subunit